MFIVNDYTLAIFFCIITMLCWGSWANTQKLAQKTWRFELFYWDYVIGILIFSILLNAAAYGKANKSEQTDKSITAKKGIQKGIILSVVAGVLMSFFYRFIAASMDLENFQSPAAGKMTPYTAVFIFSVGIFISN